MNMLDLWPAFPKLFFSLGGGDEGAGQAPSATVVLPPQYDFTEPRYRTLSDFVVSNIENINQGGVPLWLKNQLPTIREGMQRSLDETYYGLPGQRTGVLETERQNAAILGTGPGTASRKVSRALQQYESQAKAIDEFIAEQTLIQTQNTIGQLGQISAGIPKGPDAVVVGNPGYGPQQQPNYGPAVGQLFQRLGNVFANRETDQPQQDPFSLDPTYAPWTRAPYGRSGGFSQNFGNVTTSSGVDLGLGQSVPPPSQFDI